MDKYRELVDKLRDLIFLWENTQDSFNSTAESVRKWMIEDVEKILPEYFKRGSTATHPAYGEVTIGSNYPDEDERVMIIFDSDSENDGSDFEFVLLNTLTFYKEKK